MFEFLGRRESSRRTSCHRPRVRPPITIGFEQLEGREMLSAGMVRAIIPAPTAPLRSMPRPIVGRLDPEAEGEVVDPPKPRLASGFRWSRPWPIGGRFRLG